MSKNTESPAKSPLQSTNLWTGVATIVVAVFSYFFISPDLSSAGVLAQEGHKLIDSIASKNYAFLLAAVVNIGNILYHLFKK